MALLDTQRHVDHLREAGVEEDQARAHVRVLHDALQEGVATSENIKDVWSAIREIRAEVKELRAETKAEIKELRAELKSEINEVRTEVKGLRAETKAEIKELRADMNAGFKEQRAESKAMKLILFGAIAVMTLSIPVSVFVAQILIG